ncbi:MAG: hypothetical protein MJ250_00830 [Alphaproteobacteria bacterium]|nr:hypothetical protein [Alphaproteobacteria bacterium]
MKILGTLFFVLFLQGCWLTTPVESMPWNLAPLTAFGAAEVVSYAATDKFVGDHVSSIITGKNCSIERKLSGEGKYCMTEFELFEAEHSRYNVRKVYCYRSLATSTCYYEPSPNKTDVLIGVYDKPIY